MTLPLPPFYSDDDTGQLRLERAETAVQAGLKTRWAQPPRKSEVRIAAFGIDCQTCFCLPGGSLFVPGAVEDSSRACRWLYTHADVIDTLVMSLDTHRLFQIFHPSWWRDANGRVPPPMTVVRADDIASGRFIPIRHKDRALEYAQRLEAGGRYVLTLWPYHGLQGGVSQALLPSFMEACLYFQAYRQTDVHFEIKGLHPDTEHFSVFRPEVLELEGEMVAAFHDALSDLLLQHDQIFIFGQAKSHCVLSTVRDWVEHLQDPSLICRIHLLDDATSPVQPPPLDPLPPELDFPSRAESEFARLESLGVRRVRTTDAIA
ncbi:MAG: nicotinamidase [Myxococcota bacterium]